MFDQLRAHVPGGRPFSTTVAVWLLEAQTAVTHRLVTVTATLLLVTSPVAAQQQGGDCPIPSSLQPIFDLLQTIAELLLYGGIGLGVIGFSAAGILFLMPGGDNSRRGRMLAKNVFIGVVILVMAYGMTEFVATQLGARVCIEPPSSGN